MQKDSDRRLLDDRYPVEHRVVERHALALAGNDLQALRADAELVHERIVDILGALVAQVLVTLRSTRLRIGIAGNLVHMARGILDHLSGDRTRNGIGLRALGDRGLLGGYGGGCQRGVALGDVLAYLRVVIGLLRQQSVKRNRGRNAPVESALLELVRDTHADNGRAVVMSLRVGALLYQA